MHNALHTNPYNAKVAHMQDSHPIIFFIHHQGDALMHNSLIFPPTIHLEVGHSILEAHSREDQSGIPTSCLLRGFFGKSEYFSFGIQG